MIRKQSLAAVAAVVGLMIPSGAMALGISVVGSSSTSGTPGLVRFGDTITVDLVVENATLEDIFGIDIAARGHDVNGDGLANDGLEIVGGQTSFNLFADIGAGDLGIENTVDPGIQLRGSPLLFPGTPSETPAVELHAMVFSGLDTLGGSGDGQDDFGVGPNFNVEAGNVHFQVTFSPTNGPSSPLVSLTDITLEFGVFSELGYEAVGNGGSFLPFTNDTLTIQVIPEPGTGLLMGLGLAGLATIRRR